MSLRGNNGRYWLPKDDSSLAASSAKLACTSQYSFLWDADIQGEFSRSSFARVLICRFCTGYIV